MEEEKKENSQKIVPQLIEEEMKTSYLDYSMSVIVGRALPDVRDGLKPVHRRILYAMNEMGMFHNKPFKKCARIVGECFVKDTLVLTENGLIPIQEVRKGEKVYTQSGLEEVSELYMMPKKKLLKVCLENGIDNISTKSQKFKILTSDWKFVWKEAKDLEEGDYVIIKSDYPNITEEVLIGDKRLNSNIAYLLGLLMSDGWVTKDYRNNERVGIVSSCTHVVKKVANILKEEFGYLPTIETKEYELETTNGQILLKKVYVVRINRVQINQFFVKEFQLYGINASTKFIPMQIFKSPKTVIFSFLNGLIDGDGPIHKDRTVIHYGTISEKLSKQLLILLQHFNIFGRRYIADEKENIKIAGRNIKKTQKFFNIEFTGIAAQELAKNLCLTEVNKSKMVKELLKRKLKKSNYEILPFGSNKIFKELSRYHLGGGWYQDTSGKKFRAGIKYSAGCKIRYKKDILNLPLRISQIAEWGIEEKLMKIGSDLHEFIKKIINDKIYFMKVEHLEEVEEEITYDIQVKNKHEFAANGIIAHNCLGKYHPHGDMAVYDALVRMVQPFSLRYPLIKGQGNFGSIDGDNQAAMRYTEAKLNKRAEEMLQDIDKKTVRFVDNFDGSLKEPSVLPSKFPNLLVNGSSGIAVGMATNIPPHNLGEVIDGTIAFIDNPNLEILDLMKYVKGPDFPTAGIIYGKSGINNAYLKGRGKIILRAKTSIEEIKDKKRIIVSEIPYMVNKSLMLEQMAGLVRDKKIEGIKFIRDESDRKGMRVVIGLKQDYNPDLILNQLFAHTRLQVSFGIIMLALVGNEPKVLNLRQLIKCFVDHRRKIVRKRIEFDLNKASERAHVLEGLIIALDDIDNVIAKIKKSKTVEEASIVLVSDYSLTDIQAKAILDMKLQRLASLEQEKIKNEHKELLKLIEDLKAILADEKKILDIIKKELIELRERYNDERRTRIEDIDVSELEIEAEDLIKEEDMVVTITHGGYLKRLGIDVYKTQGRGGKGVIAATTKEGDFVENLFIASTHDYLLFFTNQGKVKWLKVFEIPEASRQSKGKAVVNLLKLSEGERITAFVPVRKFEGYLIMITKNGVVKKISLDLFSNPRKGGIAAISLDSGDELINVERTMGEEQIIIATRKGMAIRFSETDLRPMGRTARGVRGIRLKSGDSVIGSVIAHDEDTLFTITENGFGKRSKVSDYRLIGRGGSGVKNIICSERNGNVVDINSLTDKDDIMVMSKDGVAIRMAAKDISVIGRVTQGVRIMKLEEKGKVVAAAKIVEE